jgi:hypothetical protein
MSHPFVGSAEILSRYEAAGKPFRRQPVLIGKLAAMLAEVRVLAETFGAV